MGFRFRKSIHMGPVRLNFSKSGIGYSAGVKGFRLTKTANGSLRKTASLPGTGLSYVTESSAGGVRNKAQSVENQNDDVTYEGDEIHEDYEVKAPENQSYKQPRKKHPKLKIAAFVFVALIALGACFGGDNGKKMETIEISDITLNMDVKEEKTISFLVKPEDSSTTSIKVEASDGIDAKLSGSNINIVAGDKEGTYNLKLTSNDVESNQIMITIVDEAKKAEEKKKADAVKAEEEAKVKAAEAAKIEEEKKAEAARIEEANQAAARAKADKNAATSSQSSGHASTSVEKEVPVQQPPVQNQVWIANSGKGKKYHSNPNCSNMKGAHQIAVDDAEASGYGACSKCY